MVFNIFDWLFRSRDEQIVELQADLQEKEAELRELRQLLAGDNTELETLRAKVLVLQERIDHMEQLEKKIPVVALKDYFLKKWREGNVTWNIQGEGSQDVRIALRETPEDKLEFTKIAQDIIKNYNLKKRSIDEIPLTVMRWRKLTFEDNKYYKDDFKTFGKTEYWQRGGLTLKNYKNGFDCDDMAILMHLVILHVLEELALSSQAWRLKMCCSSTLIGGHAYNIWLADDVEWYPVESTISVSECILDWLLKPVRYSNLYQKIWFTFTREHTYSDNDFVFDKEDYLNNEVTPIG